VNPGFTFVVAATLAIGIGANTTIFSVLDGVLIRPLPYPRPQALVGVWHSAVMQGVAIHSINLSAPMYLTYRDQNHSFEQFGVWNSGTATVTEVGDPEQVRTLVATQEILPALEVQPSLGRWFSKEDDAPGTPDTVILTYGYWQRRFGGDKAVIGRAITVDSRPREVIGVMPQSFRFLNLGPEIILPQRFDRNQLPPAENVNYTGLARLKPGVTLAQANADVTRMIPMWITAYGVNRRMMESARIAPALRPLKEDVVGDTGKVLWVLMATIGIVLLIACANVANLLLVRAEGRQRELAIRAAMGAGWGRIARELLMESVTLAVLGGVLGLGLAYGGLRLLVAMSPANLPRITEISIDPLVMEFAAAVSLLSGLLFGLIPVIKYSGPRMAVGLQGVLRGGGRGVSQSRERHRSQNTLVVVQVALALVLLVGSGLMIRSFQALRSVQPGFTRPEQIQTVRISIPPTQVQEPGLVIRMQNDILDKLAAIPGVTSAAFATALPMEMDFRGTDAVSAEDKISEGQLPPIRTDKFVSPGFFSTLETPLIAGRDFTWTDIYNNRGVAIISRNMARETWGEPSGALGKRIRIGNTGAWCEIVGVAGDVYDQGVDQKAPAIVYWRAGVQSSLTGVQGFVPRSVTFAIRSGRASTEGFLDQVRGAVRAVNPNLPLASVRTLGNLYNLSMARTSFTLVMLAIAAGMALVLGIIGIYGVISYAVSQRNREIGVRLALGAQPGELQRLFVLQGLMPAGAGVAIGLGAALGLTRLMSSLLFGIGPLDPFTYVTGAFVLITAAVLASYLPGRRASRVDPLVALRQE
jgi:predicted permease